MHEPDELNGTDRIDHIVIPALRRLIRESEFEQLSTESEGKNLNVLWARIRACGETFEILVSDAETAETKDEAKVRFFQQLQDELAESKFAWGQLRD